MKMNLIRCMLLLLFIIPMWAAAQQRTIKGKVTDAKDGGPLSGATVSAGSGPGRVAATTNENGEFSIAVGTGVKELTISYVGYKDVVEKVGSKTTFNVVMNI